MAQAIVQKNIVVIGGSGTGKSSFINKVALVLRFETLEEAENGAKDFVLPIPVKTEFKKVQLVDGQDENERRDKATSRTRLPQIYRIKCGNVIFNLIDTPGMADSEGPQADQEHMKHITTCLYQYKEIHGILAVVRSCDNILNRNLKYTLNLVLSCLGKSAANMISFCITYAGHNKNPGDAPNVIRKYLNELRENPGIEYSDDNSYCFESNPLFHVLATKNGYNFDEDDRLVYSLTYRKNVTELLRFFIAVLNRNDSYNVLNVATLILAKQLQPALASLSPYLDAKDEEIKRELELMEENMRTKDLEYVEHVPKLKQIRKWTEEYKVTKTRVVNTTKKVKKPRIIQEEYMDVSDDRASSTLGVVLDLVRLGAHFGSSAATFTWKAVSKFNPKLKAFNDVATVVGCVVGAVGAGFLGDELSKKQNETKQVPKTRPKVEQYEVDETVPITEEYQDTKYVDREAVDDDPQIKRILENIEEEKAKIREIKSEKSTLYQKFKEEKQMLLELLCDLTSYLEENAIIGFDDSGLGSSIDISSCIQKLKISGQWNPTSTNIDHEAMIAKLVAIRDLENLGDEIIDILSQCENLKVIKYKVIDIPLEPNNVFIRKVIQGIYQ